MFIFIMKNLHQISIFQITFYKIKIEYTLCVKYLFE